MRYHKRRTRWNSMLSDQCYRISKYYITSSLNHACTHEHGRAWTCVDACTCAYGCACACANACACARACGCARACVGVCVYICNIVRNFSFYILVNLSWWKSVWTNRYKLPVMLISDFKELWIFWGTTVPPSMILRPHYKSAIAWCPLLLKLNQKLNSFFPAAAKNLFICRIEEYNNRKLKQPDYPQWK